ncbi:MULTISPECIES: hypothetical protein [unclassified Undibacterium]|uniref:hypothetical protein n=1 Tax=unclassified Undibacterium TaxID=2630295 RepID=UPI002AC94285|nr:MULTISPECIES: hypothetical protein [unclassified Undibacterium]MEB0139200.1 hypothetical protein [Undibacterium sp. CCC2.1]MEB0172225.1 hypothetical protein [Undibacterium sp. CCC1.1]MEB0175918.1 hypothetical protein [Undibacterium sp. CCC3.4]MEB0215222.1 hypothetical protein [Undibacterium sp. 5I2]WPX43520.1 hypothetical protein RHM61_19470 [Undibacterium sp. CCC3.4]
MEQRHSRSPGLVCDNSFFSAGSYAFGRDCGDTPARLRCAVFCDHPEAQLDGADDDINFLEEECADSTLKVELHPWKILITDDDLTVHETTLLALGGVRIHGRPLAFLHAYSAAEAKHVIIENPDLALILLDVVMETVDAGLQLVQVIRKELGLHQLRIVLRTGQPGYAPASEVGHQFAIDGYTTKSQLTRAMLISVLSDTLDDAAVPGLPN